MKDFYTVSEVANAIALLFLEKFPSSIKIKGELSGLNTTSSSHWYFSIKDKDSLLNGVCWKFRIPSLKFIPKNGDEVLCMGKLKTYGGRSCYQLDVEKFEPLGIGDLTLKLQELKKKFLKEGLFAEEHKKTLPFLPKTIGVITSETGAVIQDIIKTVEATFPSHIVLYPTLVQGNGAGEKIAEGINALNKINVDVIIIARGGGSLEDLWEFNSEAIVRAVYNSKIPVVSGVGHETDTTLVDYVADLRALTPTKAGIAVVPNIVDLKNRISSLSIRLNNAITKTIDQNELKLKALKLNDLSYTLNVKEQRLDDLMSKLQVLINQKLNLAEHKMLRIKDKIPFIVNHKIEIEASKFKRISELLESYSYKNVLSRGFVMVKNKNDLLITSVKNIKNGENIALQFKDGVAYADITDIKH